MTQSSFYLQDDKFLEFKIKCMREKKSMTEKIQEWVDDYLKAENEEAKKENIDKF